MVRKPTGYSTYKPPKAPKPIALRNLELERRLCDAIRHRHIVELRYEDDIQFRTVAPYVVFESAPEDVCLSSFQLSNPAKPQDGNEPRNFTVGKIADLRVTDRTFAIDPRFNRADPKYRHRVFASV